MHAQLSTSSKSTKIMSHIHVFLFLVHTNKVKKDGNFLPRIGVFYGKSKSKFKHFR